MKFFSTILLLTLVGTCATPKYTLKIKHLKESVSLVDTSEVKKYSKTITAKELSTQLYKFASKEFQGRKAGEQGQKLAAEFLQSYYINEGITSPFDDANYFQKITRPYLTNGIETTENVLAFIKGYEKPDEILILSAHLDHLGKKDGNIYYGADDDGSGTVAIMEIAQAFNIAVANGYRPKRSILFIHFTAEEIGQIGSRFYVENPIFPLKNTIANLNIDMIGRIDNRHTHNKNYIYLIGSDRISKELHYVSEAVSKAYVDIDLDYTYNTLNDRNQYYSRSDHYKFAKRDIPVIFYFNGEHEDYHKHTDTPDKIDYELLEKRTRLIFSTAWQLINQEHRIVTDDNNLILN
ncbi:M28 family peptidase [Hyunsoonleella sp. 2307UL5-6]|uniref:M28 family peptidase n=1 Tax=Hyunsoonleella sp. 2307UL5-6 TaxID=3384768 RepID=UPI0039BCFD81